MSILLHIDSSPMGERSISRSLTREFALRWRVAHAGGVVVYRDLAAMAIPAIDGAWIAANLTPAESRTAEQNEVMALSTELTREVLRADELVIGVPMHNWGPSSSFKLWADQIVRVGETIVATPSGMKGALEGKRVTAFVAAGRRYGTALADHLGPWVRTFFENLGVTDVRAVLVDGAADVNYGKVERAEFLAPHIEGMGRLVG
jgi:FMN-dependent NADH-azoreductase